MASDEMGPILVLGRNNYTENLAALLRSGDGADSFLPPSTLPSGDWPAPQPLPPLDPPLTAEERAWAQAMIWDHLPSPEEIRLRYESAMNGPTDGDTPLIPSDSNIHLLPNDPPTIQNDIWI